MKKTIAAIVIFLLLLSGIYLLISDFQCQQLKSPPEVPVYPGSILVKEVSSGPDVFPVHEYHYKSTASPEEIVEFYTSNKTQCHRTSGLEVKQVCSGNAKTFGIYSAVINFELNEAEPLTTYFIDVHWTRCGNFD